MGASPRMSSIYELYEPEIQKTGIMIDCDGLKYTTSDAEFS